MEYLIWYNYDVLHTVLYYSETKPDDKKIIEKRYSFNINIKFTSSFKFLTNKQPFMMRKFLLALLFLSLWNLSRSQMSNGTICPDFTGTDLNGEVHNLYSYLDQGVSVVVTISATWCGPCWNYHNSGAKEDLYNTYGPPGTGDVQVLFVEGDPATNEACLYGPSGCNNTTRGNWVSGKPFPIIHDEGPDIRNILTISGYPTVYMISAGNGRAYRDGIGGVPYQRLVDWTIGSFKMEVSDAIIQDAVCGGDGSIELEVAAGYGDKSYQWSNGSTGPVAVNLDPGLYFCTITDDNNYSIEVGPYEVAGIFGGIVANVVDEQQPSCAGFTDGYVTMNAALGNGGFTYLWDDGQTSATKSNIGAGEHYVTITDAAGCSMETFAVLDEPLFLEASATAPEIPCTENEGTVTINAFGGVGGYLYDIGGTQQTSNVFEELTPGMYYYNVTDANNCVLSDSIELTAQFRPSVMAATSDTITCSLTQAGVSGNGSSTGADFTYEWSTQNGQIISGANEVNAIVGSAGTYTLEVTYLLNGCASEASVSVQADTIVPQISTTDGELTCTETSATICATIETGHTVSWNINGQSSNDACVSVGQAGNYVATATGLNGCTATSTSVVTASDDLPLIAIDAPGSLTCVTTQVTISGNVTGGNNMEYTWTTSDGNIVDGGSTLNPTVNEAGSYTLTAQNLDNGCTSSSSIEVLANTQPPVVTLEGATIECREDIVTLNAMVGGDTDFTYEWSTTDGNIVSGENTSNPGVNAGGTYNVLVTNPENGCTTSASSVVAEDYNDPDADFTFSLNDNTFTGQPQTTNTGNSYLWDFGNGVTSSEPNPVVVLESGQYNICLEVINECGEARTCQEVTVEGSSSDDEKYISQISVFPNPATESVTLHIDFVTPGVVKVAMQTTHGVEVMQKSYQGNIQDNWDISQLPAGVYHLNVVGDDFSITRRIIVVR